MAIRTSQASQQGNHLNAKRATNFKVAYVQGALSAFNNAPRSITCRRDGWNGITATPRYHIQEVTLGQHHFIVSGSKAVLVTLSEEGMLLYTRAEGAVHVPAFPVRVRDAIDLSDVNLQARAFSVPIESERSSSLLFGRVFLTRTGIHFA